MHTVFGLCHMRVSVSVFIFVCLHKHTPHDQTDVDIWEFEKLNNDISAKINNLDMEPFDLLRTCILKLRNRLVSAPWWRNSVKVTVCI